MVKSLSSASLFKYPFWITLLLQMAILSGGFIILLSLDVLTLHSIPIFLFIVFTCILFLALLNYLFIKTQQSKSKALEDQNRQLRLVIDSVDEMLILKDKDKRWLQFNRAVRETLGVTDAWLGKRSEEIDQQISVVNNKRIHVENQLLLTGQTQHVEMKTKNRETGKVRRMDLTYALVSDCDEKFILVSGKDNTKRRAVETELRLAKEQLEAVVENIAEGILALDLDRKIIQVNSAFEEIYGWKKEEVIGQEAKVIIPESHMHVAEGILVRLQEGESLIGFETVGKRKDGSSFDISITLSPIRSAYGKIIGYSGVIRDIAQRKREEELLRKSEMLSVIGQMAAGVAHEIRNPLTSLKGFIQLIKKGDDLKEKYIDIIYSELERINMIVNEFMVLAKPQASKPNRVDFNKLLDDVVTLTSTQAVIHNVKIEQKDESPLPHILCEENQIKQVFINIIRNAIEAMPQGGLLTIESTIAGEHEPQLYISISDTGAGISKERLANLGEPFYTTKEKGTGLGLMVSMRIIRAHRGNITFESEEGVGTTVTVSLPLDCTGAEESKV